MTIAPTPQYVEQASRSFQRTFAPKIPGQRGSMRFQEGVGTDTDVPNDFGRGAFYDTAHDISTGRINHNNPQGVYKHADETMKQRAHVGSASWIEAPLVLADFVDGASAGQTPPRYERVWGSEVPIARYTPTTVTD